MHKFKGFKNALVLFTFLASAVIISAQTVSDEDYYRPRQLRTPLGDIAFEVVGQVSNLSPTVSKQFGYLSFVNGLKADQIFDSSTTTKQNEETARFTFFTDAVTERVISNGSLRIVNRTGTTVIYYDDTPDGTFADLNSFADGIPILTMNYRQQEIIDTAESGTFTLVNVLKADSAVPFELGGERILFGSTKDSFRQFYNGTSPTGTPAISGVFAGYAVAISRDD
jgi:hypothetical protein